MAKFEKLGEGRYLLDVKGYVCPHPQLYTKKSLEKLESGDLLEILFDNPSSGESIASFCERHGHEIIERKSENGVYRYVIEKA